jgi:hypothetical protein
MALVESSAVSLGIYGEDVDPEEITKLLGCLPTECYKKGDDFKKPKENRKHSKGYWGLESNLPKATDIEQKIIDLLDRLTSDLEIWKSLAQRYEIRIFCGIFLERNEGFRLSPETLACLADRGLNLDFDIYPP